MIFPMSLVNILFMTLPFFNAKNENHL